MLRDYLGYPKDALRCSGMLRDAQGCSERRPEDDGPNGRKWEAIVTESDV